jgi:HSP20 family molecular chaperone IbpA
MSLLPSKFYLDDFFDDFVPMPRISKNDMKCDIYEKEGNVHIELDIPGFKKEDVKVNIDDGILTIEATKSEEKEEKDKIIIVKKELWNNLKENLLLEILRKKNYS